MQAKLVDDLLDMNRILSGKIRIDVQDVQVPAIVEAAIVSVRPAMKAKNGRMIAITAPTSLRAPVDSWNGRKEDVPAGIALMSAWSSTGNQIDQTSRQCYTDSYLVVHRV